MTPLPADDVTPEPADSRFDRITALVNRLTAATFLVLVVLAAAGLWLRYVETAHDSRRNAENLVRVLSEYLVMRLGAVDGVLFRIVSSTRRIGGVDASEREWRTVLRTVISGVPGISSVVITDAKGTVTHATIPQIIGVSWGDRPIFRSLATGHPNLLAVDLPFSMITGDEILVPFGRALTDSRGKFIGTAITTLVATQLRDFYRTFDLGRSGIVWLLLPSGEVLFREGDIEGASGALPAGRPLFAIETTREDSGFFSGPITNGGPEYLTAFRRSTIANLILAVSLAEDDSIARWRYEALGTMAFVIIAGMLLWLSGRRIGRALQEAAETSGDEPGERL